MVMLGKSLRFWMPKKEQILDPDQDMRKPKVDISLAELPVIKFARRQQGVCLYVCVCSRLHCSRQDCKFAQVVDQDKTQNKGLLYYTQILNGICLIEADFCHSYWNVFKRSITKARLEMPLLKATLICGMSATLQVFTA